MTDWRKFEHLLPEVKVSLINEPIEPVREEPEPEPKSARERAEHLGWRVVETTGRMNAT
jgi:hypothetical protein